MVPANLHAHQVRLAYLHKTLFLMADWHLLAAVQFAGNHPGNARAFVGLCADRETVAVVWVGGAKQCHETLTVAAIAKHLHKHSSACAIIIL